MKRVCFILFFMKLFFSALAVQQTDSLAAYKAQKISNAKDSTAGKSKLKSKIAKAYNTLDKSPLTHKYIQKIDAFGGAVSNKYKRLDSIARRDTAISKAIILEQKISKSLKTRKEFKDSVNAYDKVVSVKDTLTPIHLQEDIKISETQSQLEKAAVDYTNTGSLYLDMNKTNDAIFYYEKGLNIAQKANYPTIIQQSLKGLSDAYIQKADVKKALFYFKQYVEIKDALIKLKTDQVMAELKSKYESEKKQREIQSLVLDGQKKKSELKKSLGQIEEQKQYILLIVLALFLTVVLAITLFRQYRSKKKNNETLVIQNNKIVEQKKELEESLNYTKQLQDVLKEDLDHYMQAALRKQMNPHFIFNSLNSIQSFILQNDKLSANIYLSKFAGLMRKVLENSQHQLITLEKELEVLNLYIELEEQRFDNKFNVQWNIDPLIDCSTHKLPPLIMQPYIENAIWHGLLHKEGDRRLTITIIKKAEQLVCTIVDNGIGREAAFGMKKNKSSHESLGTRITQKRIDLINSLNKSGIGVQYFDLSDNKGIANGTKVEITIPVIDEF